MALPNGAGGYQLGDGNLTEVVLGVTSPVALTGDTTLTAAQMSRGVVSCNKGSDAGLTVTTATGADIDAGMPSAKINSSFELTINNANNSGTSSTVTVTAGTGVTLYGTGTVPRHGSNTYRFVRTAEATWAAYLK